MHLARHEYGQNTGHWIVHGRLLDGTRRQSNGHLCGAALLQHADRHQHVHTESGHCRCLFSTWHTLSVGHRQPRQLDVWTNSVQGVHDQYVHHAIHIVDFPANHGRRSVHCHLPPHIVAKVPDASGVAIRVDGRLVCVGRDYGADSDVRGHH